MKRLPFAALIALAACNNRVAPVTTETNGPTVFTRTGAGTITSLSVNPDTNATTTFDVIAKDNGGVKSIFLILPSVVNRCSQLSGEGFGAGNYPYAPVPVAQSSASAPDSTGRVPTELFVNATLQGPFTCLIPGYTGIGRPWGDTITATATATNYAGKSTTVTLPITFGPWPGRQ